MCILYSKEFLFSLLYYIKKYTEKQKGLNKLHTLHRITVFKGRVLHTVKIEQKKKKIKKNTKRLLNLKTFLIKILKSAVVVFCMYKMLNQDDEFGLPFSLNELFLFE